MPPRRVSKAPARPRRTQRVAPPTRAKSARDAKAAQAARLAQRFARLRPKADSAESAKSLGLLLEKGEALLGEGFPAWAEKALAISMDGARDYRRVLELSRTDPELFAEFRDLGTAKMMRLSRVVPAKRRRALRARVEGKGVRKMSDAEFNLATRPHLKKQPVITGNMKAHGLRMKVQAMVDQVPAPSELPRVENAAVRRGLDRDLARLVRKLEAVRKRLR